jgi:hypothetical protein
MTLTGKERDLLGSTISSFRGGAVGMTLTDEQVDVAKKATFGDLVVEFGLDANVARKFENFVKQAERRNQRPGFVVNRLSESVRRRIIREEIEAITLAKADDYHPAPNSSGGKKFEDHGAGEQAGMIKSNLYSIASKAQSLHDMIGDTDELPEWVQEKIAVADEMVDTIKDYLEYEYRR